jgi:tRNA pseudouridine38-40 synthase
MNDFYKKKSRRKYKQENVPHTQHQKINTQSNNRFQLYIEYEGTRYSGWQRQENARTVQGELFKAASEIFGENNFDIQGAGRTDSGVHALCQVAHLEVNTMLAPEIIKIKMNDLLPHDVNIMEIKKTSKTFHARHDATSRSYIYQISRRRTAFGKNFVWWIKDELDFKKMEAASKYFIGMNNFASFSDDVPEDKSTKVLIDDIQLKEDGDLILIRIIGSHFIWKMVRRIVGMLAEVGRGRKTEKDILFYLSSKTNEPAKFTAPPSGLFLESVSYKGSNIKEDLISPFQIFLNKK